jgi:hypothetical protein
MSHSTHGGFLLQRYCPWGKLGFRLLIPHGILQRSNSNFLSHGSHIISVDVTSGMPCPRLSNSVNILQILTLRSSAFYPTHEWAGFTALTIKYCKDSNLSLDDKLSPSVMYKRMHSDLRYGMAGQLWLE